MTHAQVLRFPSSPDPAAVVANIRSRTAHHEAGHAVAVILKGGELVSITVADDWHTPNQIDWDTPAGNVRSRQPQQIRPFTTFAGPWAEAMWAVEHDPDVDDLFEALDYAWMNSADGDGEAYESYIEIFAGVAAQLGFSVAARAWEGEWMDELEPLWPAVCDVAALLIDDEPVTHDVVRAIVDRVADAADDA